MNEIKVKFSSDGRTEKFYDIEKAITLAGTLVIKHKDGSRSIVDIKRADVVFIGNDVEVK